MSIFSHYCLLKPIPALIRQLAYTSLKSYTCVLLTSKNVSNMFANGSHYVRISVNKTLKGPKREKLHAMHVKELIKTNYFER